MPAFLGCAGILVSRSYSPRFGHFLAPLALLLGGEVVARQLALNVFFTSLYNVLPTVLLLLGGVLCVMYGRIRELFLLLCVYIAYFLLDTHADYYRAHGQLLGDAALTFHLCSLLLPLLYGLYGLWRERSHLAQDGLARAVFQHSGGVEHGGVKPGSRSGLLGVCF